jgi:WD40 repeat protein
MGSWQQREVDVALDLQSRSPNVPVIPVLLPGCEPPLGFLRQLTWVDLRTQTADLGTAILAKAARGESFGPDLQKRSDAIRASICPYRGLLYFREEDASFFFGREAAVEKLVDAVQRQRFVAVVGASGSGKSSLVRAGLVPRLRSDRLSAWETVILVPTDQPLKALARAFLPLLEPTMGEVDRLAEANKLAEHLRSANISLTDIVQRILEKRSVTDRVLIIIDQFEELYTLTSDDEARRRFLDELLTTGLSRANVALTLRGDFVGKALAYRPLSDRLQDAQINLGPMTREELECAIRRPAEKIQLEFEPGLVSRILDDVGDEPGNLPLSEFVLKELWEKRRGRVLLNETYDSMGELQGAVATKADELLRGLSSTEQKILQRVFLRIVRPSENGLDTRRRAAFTELPPEAAKLVVKLANERLLVTNQSAGGLEQTVEVAHEALISNWSTLRSWVNEDREFLLWRERLGTLLAEWERVKESDDALLRGPLLVEAQNWFYQRSQDLSDQEQKFISASSSLRERLAREERDRTERDLKAAQRVARAEAERAEEAEKRAKDQKGAASKLRFLAWILAGATLAAIAAGGMAFVELNSARRAEKKTGEVASQANFSLASYSHEAGNNAQALAYLAQALRLNPRNYRAAAFTQMLLARTDWVLPVSNAIGGDLRIYSAQFSPDGQQLLTASWDDPAPDFSQFLALKDVDAPHLFTVRLWEAQTGKQMGEPMKHEGVVWSALFSADGKRVVTASWDKTARLWDALSGKQIGEPMKHDDKVWSAEFSPDGQRVVTASSDKTARLWDALSGKQIGEPMKHEGEVKSARFSLDGRRIVTASDDKKARLWDALTAKQIGEPMNHGGEVKSARFSPDGKRVVTASTDQTARLWDALSGTPIGEPMKHEGPVESAQFSPDGQRVVTASDDKTARLWDALSGKPIGEPMQHEDAVYFAQFSPDGQRVATSSKDGTARIWDAISGKPLSEPIRHESEVWSAQFSPDGLHVVTAQSIG